MDPSRFWSLVDTARSSRDGTAAALERILAELPRDEIVAFDAWLSAYMSAVHREDLWAAVYTIRGGCSDDSFDYFRGWLVSRGEAALLGAIRDPESLGALASETNDEDLTDERMLGVATSAYEIATGSEMPSRELAPPEIPGRDEWPADRIAGGLKWTDAFLTELYPKLWARYGAPRRLASPLVTGEIEHDRFWAIVDEARSARTEPTGKAFVAALDGVIATLSAADTVGLVRWIGAYNRALHRNDVRAVCRVALGTDELHAFAGFRGWLVSQGARVVHAFVHDLDALASLTAERPEQCWGVVDAGTRSGTRPGVHTHAWDHDPMPIPGVDAWPRDAEDVRGSYTPALLRARLPRLTEKKPDAALIGPLDPTSLWPHQRKEHAMAMVRRAKEESDRGDHAAALATLDEAVRFAPDTADTLGPRARAKAKLGDVDGALADFDEALRRSPHAHVTRFDRAKLWSSLGRRDEAIAEAERAAKDGSAPARNWLAEQPAPAAPTRARHANFGEGTIVSIEGTGDAQKITVDFAVGRKTLLKKFVELIA